MALGVDELLRHHDTLIFQHRRHGIATRDVHQGERQQRDANEDRYELDEPPNDVVSHQNRLVPS